MQFAVRCFFATFALMEQNRPVSPKGKIKNFYERGADDGVVMGVYLVALFALMVYSMSVSFAAVAAMAMMTGVPVLVFYFLRRTHRSAHGMTVFSALWMQGITMFICASLIFGLASFVYLKWIDPAFIRSMLEAAADYYGKLSGAGEVYDTMAEDLNMILRNNILPSPATLVMAWMWLIVFSGSLLSMLAAGVVKMCKVSARD